jgi:hypothetical protein
MTVEQLEKEFALKTLHRSTIVILSPNDAIRFVERAHEEGLSVFGVDGFHLHGDQVQPDMQHSVDYSVDFGRQDGAWSKAVEFIRNKEKQVEGFEVVLGKNRRV